VFLRFTCTREWCFVGIVRKTKPSYAAAWSKALYLEYTFFTKKICSPTCCMYYKNILKCNKIYIKESLSF
jgi:hypothetical protein